MNTDFNEQYAYLADEPFQRPLDSDTLLSLQTLLDNTTVDESTELFVFEIADDCWYGFIATQLVYHEVAQGTTEGKEWVACFCPVCNAGSIFVPIIDDKHLTFVARGLYHAMVLMADDQTESYWDHLSGTCLTGAYQGKQLERIGSMMSTTAKNALAKYPDLQLFVSNIEDDEQEDLKGMNALRHSENPVEAFENFINPSYEDDRLPRLTMGLGVWSDTANKFYSYLQLNANNNVIFDSFDGRNMIVYLDPIAHVPMAFYTDADSAHWHGDTLHLSNGDYVRNSVLCDASFKPQPIDLPLQLFIRWYAFVFKFPQTAIY